MLTTSIRHGVNQFRAIRLHARPKSTQAQGPVTIAGASTSNATKVAVSYPPSSAYASYDFTLAPTAAQLSFANRYFYASKPNFLIGGAKFRAIPVSSVPEVAFLGRSNVGKSSLLNALLQRSATKVANVSSKPGRTRQMNAFGIHGVHWAGGALREDGTRLPDVWTGRGGLVVLDMPGYGKASRDEWGKEIQKYLVGRQQLRRTFVLIDGEHGVKQNDMQLLELLRFHGIVHQIVLSKIDKVILPRGKVSPAILDRHMGKLTGVFAGVRGSISRSGVSGGVHASADILACSAEKDVPAGSGNKLGIDNLRWQVLVAAGLDCDPAGNEKRLDVEVEAKEGSGIWRSV